MYDPADMPLPVPADDDFDLKPPHYRWSVDGKHSWYGGSPSGEWSDDNQRQVRALYYGMITFIDDMIGRVLQALERHGLAANTHVIFTSDHGEMIDDHGQGGKPPMTYESVIRVPMLWAGPEVPNDRVHHGPMTHLDLVPTVIDLAGAPPLPGMEGRTFAPLLQGETDVHRDAVIVERIGIERHTSEPIVRQKILVTPRYKLAHYGSGWPGELYDLETDPEEFTNLWDDPAHAQVRAQLTERLLTEIIDDELGDPVTIFLRQPLSPFGSFRDPDLRDPTETYRRRTLSPTSRLFKKKDPRMLQNEHLAEQRQQTQDP